MERDATDKPYCLVQPTALLPYLVLLPMGFAEPGRSPGLLVSSYLAVSPLPRSGTRAALRPRRSVFCGTFPIRAARRATGRWVLPIIAPCGVRTFLRGKSPDSDSRAGCPT